MLGLARSSLKSLLRSALPNWMAEGLVGEAGLPGLHGAMVERSVVGERFVGDFGDDFAVMEDAHLRIGDDLSDGYGVKAPLFEDLEDFVFTAFLGDEQHALLGFAEHDLVGGHAGFALGDVVEFDLDANATASTHFTSGTGEAGSAHVLNAEDGAGLHGLETCFEQKFFEEGIANLHVGALGFEPSLNSSLAMVAPWMPSRPVLEPT